MVLFQFWQRFIGNDVGSTAGDLHLIALWPTILPQIWRCKGVFIIYVAGGGGAKSFTPSQGGGGSWKFWGWSGGGVIQVWPSRRVAFILARCALLHFTQEIYIWAPLYELICMQELINTDFSTTRLEAVFHRLRQFGLKLHPEKCLVPWSHGLCKWSGKRLLKNQGSRRLSNTNNPENSSPVSQSYSSPVSQRYAGKGGSRGGGSMGSGPLPPFLLERIPPFFNRTPLK